MLTFFDITYLYPIDHDQKSVSWKWLAILSKSCQLCYVTLLLFFNRIINLHFVFPYYIAKFHIFNFVNHPLEFFCCFSEFFKKYSRYEMPSEGWLYFFPFHKMFKFLLFHQNHISSRDDWKRWQILKLQYLGSISSTFQEKILHSKIPRAQKDRDSFTEFLRFWYLHVQKLWVNMLMKLTTIVDYILLSSNPYTMAVSTAISEIRYYW